MTDFHACVWLGQRVRSLDGQMFGRFSVDLCAGCTKRRANSWRDCIFTPIPTYLLFGNLCWARKSRFPPDRGAFLHLRPSGFPHSHSSRDVSRPTVWQRVHTTLFFLSLYLDICNTESTVEGSAATGNEGSRRRIPRSSVQDLVCMLITRSPGCPSHVLSFKNLGPFFNESSYSFRRAQTCTPLLTPAILVEAVRISISYKNLHFLTVTQQHVCLVARKKSLTATKCTLFMFSFPGLQLNRQFDDSGFSFWKYRPHSCALCCVWQWPAPQVRLRLLQVLPRETLTNPAPITDIWWLIGHTYAARRGTTWWQDMVNVVNLWWCVCGCSVVNWIPPATQG